MAHGEERINKVCVREGEIVGVCVCVWWRGNRREQGEIIKEREKERVKKVNLKFFLNFIIMRESDIIYINRERE